MLVSRNPYIGRLFLLGDIKVENGLPSLDFSWSVLRVETSVFSLCFKALAF